MINDIDLDDLLTGDVVDSRDIQSAYDELLSDIETGEEEIVELKDELEETIAGIEEYNLDDDNEGGGAVQSIRDKIVPAATFENSTGAVSPFSSTLISPAPPTYIARVTAMSTPSSGATKKPLSAGEFSPAELVEKASVIMSP